MRLPQGSRHAPLPASAPLRNGTFIAAFAFVAFHLVLLGAENSFLLAEKSSMSQQRPLSGEQEEKAKREMGIKAEMAGQWEEAIEIYKSILRQNPSQKDLWLRISDIEAHLNRPGAAAEAIEKAVQLSPEDASLWFRLAQAYSVADEPKLALNAMRRASKLDPKNLEYLRNQASLATWVGSYKTAAASFKQILSIAPDDYAAQLGLARNLAWAGKLNESVTSYKKYMKNNPEDKTAALEYARAESWRGNYPASLRILENYRKKFGASDIYLHEKARVLAWAMRPREALSMTTPLLKKDPDNYELNVSHAIALNNSFHFKESLQTLDKIKQLQPDNPQTEAAKLYIKTPMRPSLTPGMSYYADTSDLSIYRALLELGFSLQAPTRLTAGCEVDSLNARPGSGLEKTTGEEHARHDHIWLGLNHRLVPPIGLYGQLGKARIEEGREHTITYRIGGDFWVADEVRFNLERSHGFFMVSPRTVGLGIKRDINQVRLQWEPEIPYHLDASFSSAALSDTNRFWEAVFSARRMVARTEALNLDLGIGGWLFGYRYDLNNGYYDPRLYQRYMAASFGYWKFSDNDGLGFILTAGLQKDNRAARFRFSGTAELEGTFGIYKDLMLKIRGGIFELQLESGAHRSFLFQLGFTRRF